MKTKFRRIFTVVLMLCLVFSLCFAMTACNKTVDKLTSELGVVIEGEFDKGAQLVTEPIEVTGEKGKNVIALLEEKEYAKEGEVRIFDISVVKDGSKVQPSGKVKVTVPAPFESESGYVTFHIKDDNSVEELKTTYADGKISFETDSFSYFVVTEALFNTPPADVTSLRLDAANAGFTEGKATYVIGNEFPPKPENVVVCGVTAEDEYYLEKHQYTVDLGGLDFEKEGTYTITYTYKKDTSIKATLTVEVVKPKFAFQAIVGEGKGSILYGGEEMPNGYYGDHKAGEQIALKAVADSGYEFVGWYTDANEPQLISANAEHTFTTGNAPQTVKAVFNAVVTSLKLDAANAGFTDGEATYVIGSENRPDPENVLVYGVTVESKKCLDRELYTIDLGGLDFTKKDSYTITYTYTKNTSIKATLTIMVVDEGEINLTMHGSPTSYYYTGGNSIIITKSQIRNNGEECDLEALGLNWEWRDKDGNVVTLLSDHTWELDWFDSPTTAGEYKFVIYSEKDGVKTDLLTVDTVISERKVSMVTDASELRHHEHYTPIAKVTKDGTTRYYAMPIPGSFSSNMSKLPAIEVFPDADGNFMIGSKTEFSFFIYAVPKYHDVYNISIGGRTLVEEGSLYLGKSGVIAFDSTYSAGDFGVTFSFNADNSVNIKCPHEGGKLSFAYTEADGYYFTAKADDSAATYYPVYLYDKYVEPPKEHYEYIGGGLGKTYDGTPVFVDPYKDFIIRTENGEDWSYLSKYGTGRLAWGVGKGENLQPMTENEYGILEGPSEVGDYCIVFQIKLKDGTWQTVSEPLVYFSIT